MLVVIGGVVVTSGMDLGVRCGTKSVSVTLKCRTGVGGSLCDPGLGAVVFIVGVC